MAALIFGKYERLKRIAQGGMGEVFLARQKGVLDRLVILKSLRQDLAQEQDFVEQFLDEARVAATLNHPNIVAIYDVGESDGTYYIAMEYINGDDLSKLWYAAAKAGVGLPFQVSVRVVHDAALGLDHAHAAKDMQGRPLTIVHRDVSPQNIMVRADGVTKVVDFGIAKAANKSSRTQAGMVKGKLQYMSPEQVRGERLDHRSDEFSLGIVLWEMCTGRRLFKAESELQTLQKILQNPIPKPSSIVAGFPQELEGVILKMLERDPNKRYPRLVDAAAEMKLYLDRTALATGEVSVGAFIEQVLGRELEARFKELVQIPAAMSPAQSNAVAIPRATKPPSTSPKSAAAQKPVEWMVRRADGNFVHFQELATLHQWILDGLVSRDDALSPDGNEWQRLGDDPQFTRFFEIADASQRVASAKQSARAPSGKQAKPPPPVTGSRADDSIPEGPTEPLDAPGLRAAGLAPPPSEGTRPDAGGQTMQNLLDAAEPPPGGYSLGDLPSAMTGKWTGPALPPGDPSRAEGMEGSTPLTGFGNPGATMEEGGEDSLLVPRKSAAWVWIAAGLVTALALALVVGVVVVRPALERGSDQAAGAVFDEALALVRDDEPAAVQAKLAALDEAAKTDAVAAAAASVLHTALARHDKELARLREALPADPADGPVPDPGAHRVAAYRLASQATKRGAAKPAATAYAHLAMAAYQGERGATAEMDADLQSAAEKTPAAAKPQLDAEAQAIRALAPIDAALARPGAALPPPPLDAALADRRLARAVAVLSLVAAKPGAIPTTLPAALADVQDPRAALAGRVVKAQGPTPTPSGTPGTPVAAAAATDAGTAAGAVAGDAGVPAGPVEPATYEEAMAAGKKAQAKGRAYGALTLFKVALKLKPKDAAAQAGIGWSYLDLGKVDPAQRSFQAALAADEGLGAAQFGLAETLRRQDRTEEARKAYQRYLELEPNGSDAEVARNAISALE